MTAKTRGKTDEAADEAKETRAMTGIRKKTVTQAPRSSDSQEMVAFRGEVETLKEKEGALVELRRRIRRIGRAEGMDACDTGEFPAVSGAK